ncbi:RNA polymerase sigma factor [Sphingomonas canadensis]|uniref:RNA polymerase sigma factor n=1 Tax=Sphingomonas canadensis TaxID=1219257 RepID=A0ABW3HCU8_9SPHN|nr:RNA polymerase sigma factor [Sphingomonas canadensis]MCW3837281.1 RNA polymerase sigma factor [Sphingomonas canadensis]
MSLDLNSLSDGELAALSIAGRDTAFAEIMRRHREPIYRIIAGNIGNADEALDLVQETFVSAHRALGRYAADRPMRRWLATIALNKCRDWRRRRAVRRLFAFALPLDDASTQVAEDRVLPDDEVADREEMARVSRAIADLPAALREPLVLHTLQDLTQAETAAILSISEKAVETRIRRARAKLAERLGRD